LYDASDTGIAFLSKYRLEPGTTVRIKLLWYDDNAPLVPAIVRHVVTHRESYVIGCEYMLETTPTDTRRQTSNTSTPAPT
jgi:hypothetical protein